MSDSDSNKENKNPAYQSRDDKKISSILNLLEVCQRMEDAKAVLQQHIPLLRNRQCSKRDRDQHIEFLEQKLIPILDITSQNISQNAKILSPIGGLQSVHKSEEAKKKRKSCADVAVEGSGLRNTQQQSSPMKRIAYTIEANKDFISELVSNKKSKKAKVQEQRRLPLQPHKENNIEYASLPPLPKPYDGRIYSKQQTFDYLILVPEKNWCRN